MDLNSMLTFSLWGNTLENYLWFSGVILLSILFKRILSKKLSGLIFKVFKQRKPELVEVDKFFDLLIKPLEYLIVFIGLSFAFNMLVFPPSVEGETSVQDVINIAFQILIVVSVTWILLRLIDFLGHVLAKKAEQTDTTTDDQIIQFAREALKILTYIFSLLFIMGAVFKLNIGGLIAGLGIGGLAIALAAQDTLENVIASFIIFFDKPFVVGDFINVGGEFGVVEKIGFRSTRIRTLEKSYLSLPNKSLINDKLDNLTLRTFRRAKFCVGLTYDTSGEQIKAIVGDIQILLDQHPKTNEDGLVRFEEFGDSSLNITVLLYVDTTDYSEFMAVREEINLSIMDIVKKHGSDFAFPSTTVYLKKEN